VKITIIMHNMMVENRMSRGEDSEDHYEIVDDLAASGGGSESEEAEINSSVEYSTNNASHNIDKHRVVHQDFIIVIQIGPFGAIGTCHQQLI
jgi:hypothetical protein